MIKGRLENTIKDIPSWWRPVDATSTVNPFFAIPACIFSEGRYLSYLLFLQQNKIDTKRLANLSQLIGSQNKLYSIANTIEKKNPYHINQLFSFGEKTALVLSGELAGTISSPKSGLSLSSMASRECLRPLVPHIYILKTIELEINKYSSMHPKPHRGIIKHLELTQDLILKQGYIPALLYLLDELRRVSLFHSNPTTRVFEK